MMLQSSCFCPKPLKYFGALSTLLWKCTNLSNFFTDCMLHSYQLHSQVCSMEKQPEPGALSHMNNRKEGGGASPCRQVQTFINYLALHAMLQYVYSSARIALCSCQVNTASLANICKFALEVRHILNAAGANICKPSFVSFTQITYGCTACYRDNQSRYVRRLRYNKPCHS